MSNNKLTQISSRKYKRKLSPLQAIKEYCFECSGRSQKEVRKCVIHDCELYMYRLRMNREKH